MEAKTILDKIEIEYPSGMLFFRVQKQVVNNGVVMMQEPHRSSLIAGGDHHAQLALVDQHLAQMGYPPISSEDKEAILAHIALLESESEEA